MKLLARIRPEDVDRSIVSQDCTTYRIRTAGRAVIFDSNKVALVQVKKSGYYMLPGGGLDGDDVEAGLAREVLEELGCRIELVRPVGVIEVYFDRWMQRQVDYCFIARKIGGDNDVVTLTDFEEDEGYETVWAPSLQNAIALVESATPEGRDGKLVRARDLLFLQTVACTVASWTK
ncbi:MAG: NUDIX hydrolase [Candidatus Micrarchaeaceae archaeon]